MDPVSRILLDRERSAPRMLPWVILAATLHGTLAGATFFFGRAASARPAQLPAVSVKIIRPERPPARRSAAIKPRSTRPPATAVPTAAPTPVPQTRPTQPPAERPSEDAMPSADTQSSPVPTPHPDTSEPSPGRGGLSLGEGDSAQLPGIPSDFHFTYYIERMLMLIESHWYKPAVPESTRAQVRFRIHRDGRVDRIELEISSGLSNFDRAALRALYASNPLPPLPPAYGRTDLTVHLSFSE